MSKNKSGLTPAIRTKILHSFDMQGLMRTFQARISKLEYGTCQIEAPIRSETSQQHGFAHAGLTFALGDSAAGYAALSVMPEGSEVLTVEMKINLIAPAKGTDLCARGQVIKPGKRLVIVRADVCAIQDDRETPIALLQGTMIPIES